MKSDPDFMIGRLVLGRYHVTHPLARGGMGMIYLGRIEGSAGFSKPIVIKTVLPSWNRDHGSAERFAREARIVSLLRHPGIVGVIDFGRVDSAYVMVLEYVHGFTLGQWSRYVRQTRGLVSVQHAIHVILKVLEALDYAHRLTREDGTPLGIVHRDVSPANLLIDVHGQIKLHDFGIARISEDEYKTQDGSFRGTLPFAPPEALRGEVPRQGFDLYACGVVLYELLAGKNPFHCEELSATVYRVLNVVPPSLDAVRADVPPAVARLVDRMLAKSPETRLRTAAELADALRDAYPFDEGAMSRDFAEQIAHDFAGDMPHRLGLPSLEERNAAWRAGANESRDSFTMERASDPRIRRAPAKPAQKPAGAGSGTLETLPDRPYAFARRTRRKLAWSAGAVALLLAGTATAVFALRTTPAPPRFLLVEKQLSPASTAAARSTGSADAKRPAAKADAASTSAARNPEPTARAAPARATSRGAALTAAFRQQQPRIEQCFNQHSPNLDRPPMALRFSVAADGGVRSVSLSPTEIAASPLGHCIVKVAATTRFGTLEEEATFTIPILARKVAR